MANERIGDGGNEGSLCAEPDRTLRPVELPIDARHFADG
jgi:hypothetical protein